MRIVAPTLSAAVSSPAPACRVDERHLAFITDTASALNLDISPDGKTLVFDVLGDLYTVPVRGGAATSITRGPARDVRPVWSPDGQKIAFISDRDGGSSSPYLMEMTRDRHLRKIAPGALSLSGVDGRDDLRQVEWMPDSSVLAAYNFMGYKVDINGMGEDAVTKIDGSLFDRYYGNRAALYRFTRRLTRDELSKGKSDPTIRVSDSHTKILKYSIGRSDPELLPEGVADGSSEVPAVSPDGRWLIYRDNRLKSDRLSASFHGAGTYVSTIRLYDRIRHVDRVLVGSKLSKLWRDDGEKSRFSADRRFAVSPDSKAVYVSYGGQVHRIEFATGTDIVVPITIQVDQCLAPLAYNSFRIGDGPVEIHNTRSATRSPDGRQLVFNALRKLYVMGLPNGRPQALMPSEDGQFYPAYSPDGSWIAFVTWNEVEGGHIWRIPSAGGVPEKLTRSPGYYGPLDWSPDGSKLAFVASSDIGTPRPGFESNVYEGELRILTLADRAETKLPVLTRLGDPVSFTADGTRLFFTSSEPSDTLKLTSVNVDGTDPRDELPKGIESYYSATYGVISPSGHHIAVVKKNNLWIYDCSPYGLRPDGSCSTFQITSSGAYDPRWGDGGASLEWSYGRMYYHTRTEDLLAKLHAGANPVRSEGVGVGIDAIRIDLQIPRPRPPGAIALADARIITMNGDVVIDRGTVVVRAGRIVQVGPADLVRIPRDAKVIELAGKTIMPGLIDSHAHAWLARGLLPRNHWELLANLAFGVTTIKDPSNGGHHGLQYGELTETGATVGPRVYGTLGLTGEVADLNSYEDAIGAVRSMKLLGSTFVKYHTGFSRQQRQWLFDAARREGLNIAAHYPTDNGRAQFNLTTIADGVTTAEHDITESQDLFDDVKTLLVESGVGVSYAEAPSLRGGYHQAYWSIVEDDQRARAFLRLDPPKGRWDRNQLPSRGLAPLSPAIEHVVAFLADIDRRGAKILAGSHGTYDGVGMHWSMWAHARGGMSNLHVLRAATLNGAWGLGLQDDLGSIEAGKVADLLILDQNPLDDIRNTLTIESVMKDGILRDSMTLNEVWPMQTPLPAWRYQQPTEATAR